MSRSAPVLLVLALAAGGVVLSQPPASSAGGMGIPSTGSVGGTGYFLSCRSTSSSTSSTQYYDQQNVLKTWDCGTGKRSHKGVDILGSSTPGVSPVFAAAAGVVWTAERGNGFGWRVVLRHGQVGGNGRFTYTIYGHMGNCASGQSYITPGIVPGTSVGANQHLGFQGDDGYPNGCAGGSHVHWEVRVSDSDVDNVFLAVPASPNFYTGIHLTADDPVKATSVRAAGGPASSATPIPWPSLSPRPSFTPWPWPTFTPRPWPTFSPRPTPTPGSSPTPTVAPSPRPRWTPPPDWSPRPRRTPGWWWSRG